MRLRKRTRRPRRYGSTIAERLRAARLEAQIHTATIALARIQLGRARAEIRGLERRRASGLYD